MPWLKMFFLFDCLFVNIGDFDEDPYFSPLSCDGVPYCMERILPEEIKMNSIHKDFFNKSQKRHPPPPPPD